MLGQDITNQKNLPLKTVITRSFVGGVFWGLGTIIGATILVAIIGFILSKIISIPLLGSFVGTIIENIPR